VLKRITESPRAGEIGASEAVSRLLVVEDDESFGNSIAASLLENGYKTVVTRTSAQAREMLKDTRFDLVLLGLGLPDADGFAFCREISTDQPDLPVIIVTARGSNIDVVTGLDSGAVDYIAKPFSLDVLLARVRAHLRCPRPVDQAAPLVVGELVVSPASHLVMWKSETIDLRNREFDLLVYLCRHVGQVVTRRELFAEIWDVRWENSSKTLDMHIHALRVKVGAAIEITTIRGVGYRLESA
jgi:DNA-binding response OmpR family regulator